MAACFSACFGIISARFLIGQASLDELEWAFDERAHASTILLKFPLNWFHVPWFRANRRTRIYDFGVKSNLISGTVFLQLI